LNPENVIINYNLARAYLSVGRIQDAGRIFEEIRRIDPHALIPAEPAR
jgi:predicted Zn-dependent protease